MYGADDPVVAANVADAGGTPVPFTTGRAAPGARAGGRGGPVPVPGHEGGLWRAAALRLPGRHNLANAIAASGVAMALGAHPAGMARAVAAFRAGRTGWRRSARSAGSGS